MMDTIRSWHAWYKRPNKSTIAQYIETFVIIVPIAFIIRTYFYGLYQVPTGSMEVTMLVGERFFADKFTILFKPAQRGDIITFNDPLFDYSDNKYVNLFQRYVWGPSNWTKRVIGIPGDHVQGKIEDGKPVVYLNGDRLNEPYINPYPLLSVYREGTMPPWVPRSYDPSHAYADQPFYFMTEHDVERAQRLIRHYNDEPVRYPQTPMKCYGRIVDEFDVHLGDNQYWVMGDNRLGSNDSRMWGILDGKLIHGTIKWRLISIDSNESWLILDILKHPIDFWKRVRWSRFFQAVH
jgi:signal peptidase I